MKTKKMFQGFLFIAVFVFGIIVFSCTKEGAVGPQGPAGTNGTNGTNGIDGNANVKTYSVTAPLANFVQLTATNEYYINVNMSSANIGLYDAVLVYFNRETLSNVNYWAQLPFDDWYNTSYYIHHNFEMGETGTMFINLRNSSGSAPYSPMTGNIYYKVVVIKGTAAKKAHIPSTLNTQNYEQIKTYYNLKD